MMAAFDPGLLIVPSIVVVVFVVIIRVARVQARKTREQMQAFAQRAGLRLTERTALGFTAVESLDGEQHGRAIRYWTYATGSGKSRTTWVAVGVRPQADNGLQFDLTRQNFGTKIMELFGAKEIQVGDPAFDQAWYVRTNQPEFFAAALVPQIRAHIMAGPEGRWGAAYKLEKGLVQYVEQGSFTRAEILARLERQLSLLHELADVAEVFATTGR